MLLDKRKLIIDEKEKYKEKISEIVFWYLEKIYYKVENNLVEVKDCEDFLITISNVLPILPDSSKNRYIDIGYRLAKQIKEKIEDSNFKHFYPLFYEGLGYSAYSIYSFNKNTGLLPNFLKDINRLLLEVCYKKAEDFITSHKNNSSTYDYDIIYGLSGNLNYLLEFKWNKIESSKIEKICTYLVTLMEDYNYQSYIVPKAFIPYENLTDYEKESFIDGNLNLSLCHGIAGPLKVLAIAQFKKYNVEGLDLAISRFFNIYNQFEIKKGHTISWPPHVDIEEYNTKKLQNMGYNMDYYKWCYGAFSLSLVLEQTAIYLGDKEKYIKYSENCKKIAKYHFGEYSFFTPNICHGYASMLAMQLLSYQRNKDKTLITNLEHSINNILNCFNEKNEYGFKLIIDPKLKQELKDYEIISYDFLEGTTGIILALSLIFNEDVDFNKLLFFDYI